MTNKDKYSICEEIMEEECTVTLMGLEPGSTVAIFGNDDEQYLYKKVTGTYATASIPKDTEIKIVMRKVGLIPFSFSTFTTDHDLHIPIINQVDTIII